MTAARLPFLDWMKAIGMFLIVFGHVVGGTVNLTTPPIYHKQWGVAFFLFATTFTLAREQRPTWRVVVNRLFEVLLVTGLFAVAATVVSLANGGRGQLSNFTPLVLGVNVLSNNFPANPTTWYVGTYMHVVLLWAVLRKVLQVRSWWFPIAIACETCARYLLWEHAGGYVAYQALPNWLTILLLGLYVGRQRDGWTPAAWISPLAASVVLLSLVLGWTGDFDIDFPFRRLTSAGAVGTWVSAAAVTAVYASATWLVYRVTLQWLRWNVIEWLASQTVFIFVTHMPLFYVLLDAMRTWPRWQRAVPLVVFCYFGLAVVGAMVYRVLRPEALREALVRRFVKAV